MMVEKEKGGVVNKLKSVLSYVFQFKLCIFYILFLQVMILYFVFQLNETCSNGDLADAVDSMQWEMDRIYKAIKD